jgi:ABC-type Na+ transport system ATPase subunit NatA
MSNIDLLSTVLPTEGYYCVAGLGGGRPMRQSFHETREEVDAKIAELVADKRDVYFALARFETAEERKKPNVKLLRSFWLDIDCGEAKAVVDEKTGKPDGYIDQYTAVQELHKFCELVGLPLPILVNSGRGIHAYWPLDRDVTRAEWEPVGKRLAQLCVTHKLYADPNVFEVARILRVPGTFNFKDDPPLPVEVISEDPMSIAYEEFKNILGVSEEAFIEIPKREMSELGKLMQENIQSSFTKIMRRSAEGNGCQQILSCFNERETLSEPRWFNALSVAKFCKDADKAIHKMSSGHPDYDPVATVAKISHIVGPHTCAQFEKNNPGGCEGCPFSGKVGSPISLGREVVEAPVTEQGEYIVETTTQVEEAEAPLVSSYTVPKYPEPFVRGKNGGIYLIPKEEEADPIKVYDHDLYIVKRLKDPAEGEVFLFRRHLPLDGVEEFVVPNEKVVDKNALRSEIARRGILCVGKQWDHLLHFITLMAKDLQYKQRLLNMRQQFGWADNDSKFIIGDREITKDGIFYSPPSSVTKDLAAKMYPQGSIAKWKEVFSLYGKPGHEPHAYATLSAFGSPLLKFTGQKGSIINVIHPRSGTGKTTILRMINSVYGMPDDLCAAQKDTANAKITHLGILNNLPFTVDEITNTSPMDFSDLVYSMSQGRGKQRMNSQTNSLRVNNTTWQAISVASSNASFYEKLSIAKASPDGEMMRLLEYKVGYTDVLDPAFAKQMFDFQLMENFGHAGDIYATYLVNNLEEVKSTIKAVQAKIDKEIQVTQRERCWSANIAANITGGMIAERLGLIDWDMKAIYKWVTSMIKVMRDEVVQPVTDNMAIVGDFLNRHMGNILVVNDEADRRTNMQTMPSMEPKGDLVVRYEPDTKLMFIDAKRFKNDCIDRQVNFNETVKELKQRKILLDTKNKRLSKGMKVPGPAVRAMVLDTTHSDFLKHGLDPNASGEG